MRHRLLAVLLLLVAIAPLRAASAQDESVDDLKRAFGNLVTSLQNMSSGLSTFGIGTSSGVTRIGSESLPAIRSFRDRVDALRATYPVEPTLIAMDIQLSAWLKENDRVGAGFRKLVEVTGDVATYGPAWLDHARSGNDLDATDEVFEYLVEYDEDGNSWATQWADLLMIRGRYGKALELLEGADLDPAVSLSSVVSLADCLFVEHRFSEASAVLDAIPEDILNADADVQTRADLISRQASEYAEAWSIEQALRAAEGATNLPRARFETSRGPILIALYEDQAPNTVANFITLVDQGLYDGTKLHRVLGGQFAVGGDPASRGDVVTPGSSNPGYYIADEHGRDDARKHFSGVLAMDNKGNENTAGCIWYLAMRPLPERDGRYTVFGRVVQGLDVVRSMKKDDVIEAVTILSRRDHPYEPVTLPLPGAVTPDSDPESDPESEPDSEPDSVPDSSPDSSPDSTPDGNASEEGASVDPPGSGG
jgi:cyclophilin family peptidyl-prolyl cis-trans isomerase